MNTSMPERSVLEAVNGNRNDSLSPSGRGIRQARATPGFADLPALTAGYIVDSRTVAITNSVV